MDMFETATKIVRHAFKEKTDKAGKPYTDHLFRVVGNLPYAWDDLKVIALLHDLLEDCHEWNHESLRVFFTDKIVDTVVLLTHKDGQSYEDYITQVLTDGWAILVKKADLEDNMNVTRLAELTDKDIERLKKYHKAYLRIINRQL